MSQCNLFLFHMNRTKYIFFITIDIPLVSRNAFGMKILRRKGTKQKLFGNQKPFSRTLAMFMAHEKWRADNPPPENLIVQQ